VGMGKSLNPASKSVAIGECNTVSKAFDSIKTNFLSEVEPLCQIMFFVSAARSDNGQIRTGLFCLSRIFICR
jgi:hypothetical protein